MCGRFTLFSQPGDLARLFEVDAVRAEELPPRYNVSPTQEVYAVAEHPEGERRLGTLVWGLVPHWAEDPRPGPINARAETLRSKPMFRDAFARRRCIIPADGFYEWREDPRTGAKVPHYVRRADGEPLALAGLWASWRPKEGDGEPLHTCVIVTTDAAGPLRDVHPRMPAILPREAWDVWLDRYRSDTEELAALLESRLPEGVEMYAVSTRVNNAGNEGADLIEPAAS
jgi:putative SOS response-associated peptidase YedK